MNSEKKRRLLLICLLIICMALFGACGDDIPQEHVDLSDPVSGDGIYTTAELIDFIESGASDTATLGASIDLGGEILRITKARGSITICGNGFSITGNGDCVLRLEDGCTLRLEDISIMGGRNGIGCLGDAMIGGNAEINSVAHCITGVGDIVIQENSSFTLASNVGCGIQVKGLTLLKKSAITANGALGAVSVAGDELTLGEDAALIAATEDHYNALKCEGTLTMQNGSLLRVTNNGEYHGAEIRDLSVEGLATLEAAGGEKGVGVFLFEQEKDIYLVGSCTPELRFEVGDGSVTFVADASEIPEPEPEPDAEGEDAEPEEQP